MSCSICLHSYTDDRKPMFFPCTHIVCKSCLEKMRSADFSYTCWCCRAKFPDITVAVVIRDLIDCQNLDDKIAEIQDQRKCLEETRIIIKLQKCALRAARETHKEEIARNFKKIEEEITNQLKKYQDKYKELKDKEYKDIKNTYKILKESIKKRDDILRLIQNRTDGRIPNSVKDEILDLGYPKEIKFAKFEINFEDYVKQIPDKVMELFWSINQTFVYGLDLDHLASEPYKRFKPNNYSGIHPTSTIIWDKDKFSQPID